MCVNNTLQQRQQHYEHQPVDEDDDDEGAALIRQNCDHTNSNQTFTNICCISRTNPTPCSHQHQQLNETTTTAGSPSNVSSATASTFNCKYRRKHLLLLLLVAFHICSSFLANVAAYNCSLAGGHCHNDGKCKDNGQCVCADGWQGPECQFCGGKVRYVI